MKKQVKAVICVVLAVWFFLMGFELGKYKEKNKAPETVVTVQNQTTAAPIVETQPTTQAPLTTLPSVTETTNSSDNTSDTTKAEVNNNDPASLSKEQIIAKMGEALDTAKASKASITKSEKVTINLTDLSVQRLMSAVQSVINNLAGDETESYTLENGLVTGTDADGKAVTGAPVSDYMPPKAAFKVAPEGVAQASATKDGDKIVYKLKTVDEKTTIENPVPQYSSAVYSYLDIASINIPIPGVKITGADMHYPGTEITMTVDASGKLVRIEYNMPMDGTGTASIFGAPGTASFEGSDVESWDFVY